MGGYQRPHLPVIRSIRICEGLHRHAQGILDPGLCTDHLLRHLARCKASEIGVRPRVAARSHAGAPQFAQFPPTHERLPGDPRWLARPCIRSAAVVAHHEDSSGEAVAREDGESVFVDAQEPVVERQRYDGRTR